MDMLGNLCHLILECKMPLGIADKLSNPKKNPKIRSKRTYHQLLAIRPIAT